MAEFENTQQQDFEGQDQFEERVIEIARVAKVVKVPPFSIPCNGCGRR
jgi:ribosomal protein S5